MSAIDERTGKPKIILHLCAKMGSDSLPYKEAGYDVRIIGEDIGVENYNPPENVYGIISNPPCTMFSIARSKSKKPRDLCEGMKLVKECLRIIWECQYSVTGPGKQKPVLKFWCMENPSTGFLKWFMGNPAFQYSPYEYGESYSKKTALWGMFNLPARPLLFNPVGKGHCIGKKWLRWKSTDERSKCCYSFAKAFFEANQ
jgi:hypothetical protein